MMRYVTRRFLSRSKSGVDVKDEMVSGCETIEKVRFGTMNMEGRLPLTVNDN